MAISNCITSSICEQAILNNIVDSCDNPMFSGIEQAAIIINKGDISKVVTDANNPRIVTDIIMRTYTEGGQVYTKKGFSLINARNTPYQGTSTSVAVGDYKNTFTRTVSLFIPMDGAKVSMEILDPMANGKFVIIMQNQYVNEDGDNQYQIYGIDKGLRVSEMTQTKYENNDYWLVTFTEEEVPNSGRWIMHEEYKQYTSTSTLSYSGSEYAGSVTYTDLGGMHIINNVHFGDDEITTVEIGGTSYYSATQEIDGVKYGFYTTTVPDAGVGFVVEFVRVYSDTSDYLCTLLENNIVA